MEKRIRDIKDRCLEKEDPFCASACPFRLDVREFIGRMQRGAFNSAFRLFSNTVGFPAIVAALCLLTALSTLRTCLLAALIHLLRSSLHYGVQVVDS